MAAGWKKRRKVGIKPKAPKINKALSSVSAHQTGLTHKLVKLQEIALTQQTGCFLCPQTRSSCSLEVGSAFIETRLRLQGHTHTTRTRRGERGEQTFRIGSVKSSGSKMMDLEQTFREPLTLLEGRGNVNNR